MSGERTKVREDKNMTKTNNEWEKEFPEGKENYCPRCYFEDDKTILRENCPHNIPDSEKEEWGGWKIVSDMLDHPDENGIYPTSECYRKLYEFVVAQKEKALSSERQRLRKIVQSEIAKADKYEIAPLQRIMVKLLEDKSSEEKEIITLNRVKYQKIWQH